MEIALILAALNPTDAKVAQAITPLLVRNLHPKTLPKDGPPDMLLESIKTMGVATVPLIFKDLEDATSKLGNVAAYHRKYLFLALERLGNLAHSKENLSKVASYTSPQKESYPDVRLAAGKARSAMTRGLAKQADSPSETHLVFGVLEDLYGSTWPDAATVGDARTVKSFIARRERVLNDLKTRFQDVQLGGKHSPALLELLEHYETVLNKGKKHADQLDAFEEEVKKKWLEMFTRVSEADPRKRLESSSRAIASAADYFAKPPADPFADLFAALCHYPYANEQKLRTMQEQATKQWKDYFAKAKLEYERKARPLAEVLVAEAGRDLEVQRKSAEKLKDRIFAALNANLNDEYPNTQVNAGYRKNLYATLAKLGDKCKSKDNYDELGRFWRREDKLNKFEKSVAAAAKAAMDKMEDN